AEADFTDLHAWTEVYLPGAGWLGLDPTSGLLAGEGHIPLACTPDPQNAAPVSGSREVCETKFEFHMSITRVHEDPRVTKPYTEEQWASIETLGREIDQRLEQGGARLTQGGEPTFVSIDDMQGPEWTIAALGEDKRKLAGQLLHRLNHRFATGGLLHHGQGKWYPGEQLPRWALSCWWRKDGQPIWRTPELLADPTIPGDQAYPQAERFAQRLAERLQVGTDKVVPAYEDALYYLWRERRLPVNVTVHESKLEDEEERARLARVFEQGLSTPTGCMLPLTCDLLTSDELNGGVAWRSGLWPVRADQMFLVPGDSPMGLRLPLASLPFVVPKPYPTSSFPLDPMAERQPLPDYERLSSQRTLADTPGAMQQRRAAFSQHAAYQHAGAAALEAIEGASGLLRGEGEGYGEGEHDAGHGGPHDGSGNGHSNGGHSNGAHLGWQSPAEGFAPLSNIISTALCVEARGGHLHVFMPPLDRLEAYLNLVAAVEETAAEFNTPVVIEGYLPPHDPRVSHIKVTPDPGVIEVNVQPAHHWDELVNITTGVYEDARYSRLGTEKFGLDGSHSGTGGGNHIVLGGPTPAESPFLQRPDLLGSLVTYWHNHPALSYLFSGGFIGPTSQAPRVDEGRRDSIYELAIAMQQLPPRGDETPPWLVDRLFRHLLVDGTGNTHRAEFCIDKLFSPDASSGRLGLVELRAMEMPPHARMSLTQQLLIRALVARFWEQPYQGTLAEWGTTVHDRFMLPHFIWQDLQDVLEECGQVGLSLRPEWFAPHFEFRFPLIGEVVVRGVRMELRRAIEPWYVLGEEPAGGYTARYVDSSLERMQILVRGMTDSRHMVTCNGHKVPLHPTGTEGEYVAGVRFRAWQPPNCLHPTIGVDEPLVFDLLDTWMERSMGGCRYHTGHPGGLNPEKFPINAFEAESRRASRFFRTGHTGGKLSVPPDVANREFPLTLDLRRLKKANR
ncbi:MAG: transglutaminase family protein, partial [Planctomycetia bacterium]|nr:transglutaminase family protein [Planctomycetia bacterium]